MSKKENMNSALEVGKKMAARALKRRNAAAKTRQLATAKIKTPVTRRITPGPKDTFAKAAVTHDSAGVLIAEGGFLV